METTAHLELKQRALGLLRSWGCRALATEVRCPIARFRLDVAGWLDRPRPDRSSARGRRRPPVDPRTVVIECKQTRGDFLRDRRDAERLLADRRELERLRRRIEQDRIKVHEPHLRRSGTALFPELEVWDFADSRLRAYHKLADRIRDVERRLYGETKFFTVARYRLADFLYLAAPAGVIRAHEVPPGWGLLEGSLRSGRLLKVTVEAPVHSSRPDHRVRLLRNIAASASRAAFGSAGD